MGLDQFGQVRNKKIDFEKVYSDEYEPTVHGFVWRKHSRLQTFMSDKFAELNPNAGAMNGDDELVLTKEIIMELRKEVDSSFHNSFCSGGFFGNINFKKNRSKNILNKIVSSAIGLWHKWKKAKRSSIIARGKSLVVDYLVV